MPGVQDEGSSKAEAMFALVSEHISTTPKDEDGHGEVQRF